ncbi:protein NYNRIN [Trichonephila clavipes]|nr:protein NYNRIN [Trichonephila clavipes]
MRHHWAHGCLLTVWKRQLRTSDDIRHDIRQVIDNDNFVPEMTPCLKRFANSILDVKDRVEQKQDFVTTGAGNLCPREKVLTLRSPVTYEIADPVNPDQTLGIYHVSTLKDYQEPNTERNTGFVAPLRKRGRPKKKLPPGSEPRRQRNQRRSL